MQRLLGYPNQTCILYHDYHVQSHTCHEVKKTVFREVVLQSRFCWSGRQHRGSSPSLFSARCHHWSAAVFRRPHSGRFLSLSTCEHETSGGRWTHGNHGRNRGRWTQYTMAIRSDLPTKCVDRFCLASTIPSENPKDTIVFSLPLAPQHDFAGCFFSRHCAKVLTFSSPMSIILLPLIILPEAKIGRWVFWKVRRCWEPPRTGTHHVPSWG